MNVMELFSPMLPAVGCGLITVFVFAFLMGSAEKRRIGATALAEVSQHEEVLSEEKAALLRPKLFPVNLLLIVFAIVGLIGGGFVGIGPAIIFMVAFVLAVVINYPSPAIQKERVDAHAKSAIMMASVLFAAGAFTGIMKDTGMITAMADTLVSVIPENLGRVFPIITGVIAMPASLLFDPDSFYFGVLPVLGSTAAGFGVEAVNVARAAILGQMTTGFPVSPLTPATFLLVGLAGVDLADHQKKTIPLAFCVTIVMLIVGLVTGGIQI
jgi:CitMHS family citrate-Mg2+:H+ or citrate-Ca2+:H+ symporter